MYNQKTHSKAQIHGLTPLMRTTLLMRTVPLMTAPLMTAPLMTAPLMTAPLMTAPLMTAPLMTAPLILWTTPPIRTLRLFSRVAGFGVSTDDVLICTPEAVD